MKWHITKGSDRATTTIIRDIAGTWMASATAANAPAVAMVPEMLGLLRVLQKAMDGMLLDTDFPRRHREDVDWWVREICQLIGHTEPADRPRAKVVNMEQWRLRNEPGNEVRL